MSKISRGLLAATAAATLIASGCGDADLNGAPDVEGLTLDTAKEQLRNAGYSADVSDDALFGVIIESHFTVCSEGSPVGKVVPLEVSKDC